VNHQATDDVNKPSSLQSSINDGRWRLSDSWLENTTYQHNNQPDHRLPRITKTHMTTGWAEKTS